MHIYQERHGRLPPAVVYGKYGEALHSWRVLLLPYIEQDALFKQFKLDEPWDSPHNIQLLPKIPSTYAAPGRKADLMPPYHTVCMYLSAKGRRSTGRKDCGCPRIFRTARPIHF